MAHAFPTDGNRIRTLAYNPIHNSTPAAFALGIPRSVAELSKEQLRRVLEVERCVIDTQQNPASLEQRIEWLDGLKGIGLTRQWRFPNAQTIVPILQPAASKPLPRVSDSR